MNVLISIGPPGIYKKIERGIQVPLFIGKHLVNISIHKPKLRSKSTPQHEFTVAICSIVLLFLVVIMVGFVKLVIVDTQKIKNDLGSYVLLLGFFSCVAYISSLPIIKYFSCIRTHPIR